MAKTRTSALIVDDHPELAENIIDILSQCLDDVALSCVAAKTTEDALKLAEARSFQLALLDLHLPDGNGLQLLRELKKKQPFLQVVVITGDATVESAIGALQEGAFGYVLKPFHAQQLVEVASKAIVHSRLLQDRENLQQQLEKSERLSREVIDRIPAFVIALDESGRIVVWNRTLEEISGFAREEMIGQFGEQFVDHGDTRRLPLKGGGHRSVRWKRAVVPQAEGTPPVTYAVGVDVTEESEMQRRTMRAERLAAVGTLAAGLAHEVRNPLNSATLQLQLLERRIAKGRLDEASVGAVLQVVKGEIERLDHLVSDFLAFAKPRPIELEVADLNELARSVARLMKMEAAQANVTLTTSLDASLGPVPLEPERLRQVILNLVRNGIQAAAETGGRVAISTRPTQSDATVQLLVEDTGCGFPDDSPVFDAFYTTKDNGTGLGLAIVHRIVSEHGGSIHVTSKPGHTRFTVELPQPASPRLEATSVVQCTGDGVESSANAKD